MTRGWRHSTAVWRASPVTRESGSGTVLVLTVIALLLAVLGAALALGQTLVARHRAASAADLAALAAADRALEGSVAACDAASAVASAHEAQLIGCRLDGDIVEIVAAVALPTALTRFGPVTAQARAGPAISRLDAPHT